MDKHIRFDEFEKRHNEQVEARSQKDVFMIWAILMFLAVIAAHFLLHMTLSPTGYILATPEAQLEEISSLLAALGIFGFATIVGGAAYIGITNRVK